MNICLDNAQLITDSKKDYIVTFLEKYGSIYGMPTPDSRGILRAINKMKALYGTNDVVVLRLPISHTRSVVYEKYTQAIETLIQDSCSDYLGRMVADLSEDEEWRSTIITKGTASFSYFIRVWEEQVPHIMTTKKGSDFCDLCTAFKSRDYEPYDEYVRHREEALEERNYYVNSILAAKAEKSVGKLSLDWAEAMYTPHLAQAPGIFYFQVQRRVPLFGIAVESSKMQFNFVHEEGGIFDVIGKGSDSIICALEYTLAQLPNETETLVIHADNCPGQGKNNYMLQYMMYLVLMHRFSRIEYCFMVAGHTKFAPGSC